MSLTSHLHGSASKDSPVRGFLRQTFPNTRGPLAECREALCAPLVLRLDDNVSGAAYGQIGTAIDYRLRYHFAITPPRELVAFPGALLVTGTPHPLGGDRSIPGRFQLSKACVSGFLAALDQTVNAIAAHRQHPTDAEERTLAPFCLVLAALEAVQRGGTRAWPPPYFGDTLPHSAADLLASVPDEWVEDAACLGTAFSARYPEWQGANAELNPEFAGSADIDGADADLIADGCLWEIKTTKRQGGQGAWLHQLLGYALLDYEDQYAIERVGLLLPRHNTQVSWPIRELIAAMSGRDDLELADLRERFRSVCEGVREEQEEAAAAAVDRRDVPD